VQLRNGTLPPGSVLCRIRRRAGTVLYKMEAQNGKGQVDDEDLSRNILLN